MPKKLKEYEKDLLLAEFKKLLVWRTDDNGNWIFKSYVVVRGEQAKLFRKWLNPDGFK